MLSMAMVMVEVSVTDHVLTLRFDVKYGHGRGGGVEVSVTDHVLTLRFDVKYGHGHGGGVSD